MKAIKSGFFVAFFLAALLAGSTSFARTTRSTDPPNACLMLPKEVSHGQKKAAEYKPESCITSTNDMKSELLADNALSASGSSSGQIALFGLV